MDLGKDVRGDLGGGGERDEYDQTTLYKMSNN